MAQSPTHQFGQIIGDLVEQSLRGLSCETATIEEAIGFIESYDESALASTFCRYELNVRYSNGDEVRANFASKIDAIRFLSRLR
ncbi:MAG: hypothetical protein HY000_13010 [Planctomycetes bacterium]|nr:hypothetical protein [Planctomycetota bacterium]